MEHIAAILLLVGCSHGGPACEEVQAPQVAFESMEECMRALPSALGIAGTGRRLVYGRCAPVDPAWAEEDVEIIWRLTRQDGLDVRVRPADRRAEGIIAVNNTYPAQGELRYH